MNITPSPTFPAPSAATPPPSPAAHVAADSRADLQRVTDRLGGHLLESPQGPEFEPKSEPGSSSDWLARGAICPLPDYGRLTVTGADADSFLQNQLTNDVLTLQPGEARWTGYCSPKGRLLTTALNWREPDQIMLAVARSQSESLRKRLAMFVLRAKTKVIDQSAGFLAIGLLGKAIDPVLVELGLSRPTEAMTVTIRNGFSVLALPAVTFSSNNRSVILERVMLWLPIESAVHAAADGGRNPVDVLLALLAADTAAGPVLAPTAVWRWSEVLAAVPRLFPASSELFVPQMINFEAIGGVNFKKGCYPGQEIVARSQYLGKLKRRMYRGRLADAVAGTASADDTAADGLPQPGQDVSPLAGGEPCGQVVLSARAPDGGIDVLFETQISAVENGGVAIAGRAVRIEALPYEVKR